MPRASPATGAGPGLFRIDTVAPSVPTLIYPVNGKVTKDNTPWLDWSDVTDVTGVRYQLQVDDNADFSSPVVNKTSVSLSSTTLPVLPDGVYYWRVRAVDNAGNAGDWSGAWSITVDTAAPPMPTLTIPRQWDESPLTTPRGWTGRM